MREARSIANALLAFALFLLVWAFFVPGHAGATHGPRFVRVLVEDAGAGHEGDASAGESRLGSSSQASGPEATIP